MSQQPTESKPLLSHTIAEWACSLNYEHLSADAIQAEGKVRTYDMGGKDSTLDVAKAIAEYAS